ncbi:hypothetical protein ABK040_004616 [Willaertia magna]
MSLKQTNQEEEETKNVTKEKKRKQNEKQFSKTIIKKLKEEISQHYNKDLNKYIHYYFKKEITKELNNYSLITNLPFEILLNILQFLDFTNLLNLNIYLFCKNWYNILFNNEYFWNLQFFNYINTLQNEKLKLKLKRENSKKKYSKKEDSKIEYAKQIKEIKKVVDNTTIKVNDENLNLEKINKNWKEKRNFLFLKYSKCLQQKLLIENKTFNNTYVRVGEYRNDIEYFNLLDLNSNIYSKLNNIKKNIKNYNEMSVVDNKNTNLFYLFFNKRSIFTKVEIISVKKIEDDGGEYKSDGLVEGYYFHNENLCSLKFKLQFKINYLAQDDSNTIWNYSLKFKQIHLSDENKHQGDDNEMIEAFSVIKKEREYGINKKTAKTIKKWLNIKDGNDWIATDFLDTELYFLKDYNMGLNDCLTYNNSDSDE